MPSLGSRYTFEDFLKRLERSPVSYMAPLYYEHHQLFVNRPDMFSKAILSINWERGLALVQTAYYANPVAPQLYRAVLARMLMHNRHVNCHRAGKLVPWAAALSVFSEGSLAHGPALHTRVSLSTLRLLAPHRRWMEAISILQISQANRQLTKPMLIDAAQACATEHAWPQALKLLMHVHQQDPALLSESIQSLRPVGTDSLSISAGANATLPTPAGRTREQQHILRVLNDVVGAVPWQVSLKDPLCMSYLTHLIASTTDNPEDKVGAITTAIRQLPWEKALELLTVYTEPSLVDDSTWGAVTSSQQWLMLGHTAATSRRVPVRSNKRRSKRSRRRKDTAVQGALVDAVTIQTDSYDERPNMDACKVLSRCVSSAEESSLTLSERMLWMRCLPSTIAALLAVFVHKLPSKEVSVRFVQQNSQEMAGTSIAAASHHPVVVHALLRKCTEDDNDGWQLAAPLLLSHSSALQPTPTDILSNLVLQLRRARRASLLCEVLQRHIIPSGSKLTPSALEALFQCVLAHNRAVQEIGENDIMTGAAPRVPEVHWLSALSWAIDLQAPTQLSDIVRTGTGPSEGAISREPRRVVERDALFTPRLLSSLLSICVLAGSPQGALRAMGYARATNKTELFLSDEIRALLYCTLYDRPYEAAAIVRQAEVKHGAASAQPLRHLLTLAQVSKEREAKAVLPGNDC